MPDSDFGTRVYFLHQKCSDAFREARDSASFEWLPLECLPCYIGMNLAVDWKAAWETVDRLAGY
jgi:hypothetical protein